MSPAHRTAPLAAGRLARPEWSADTLRSRTDKVAASKYDSTQESDRRIVKTRSGTGGKYAATTTQIALAWQFAKGVTSPIIGATKAEYFDDAAGALNITPLRRRMPPTWRNCMFRTESWVLCSAAKAIAIYRRNFYVR